MAEKQQKFKIDVHNRSVLNLILSVAVMEAVTLKNTKRIKQELF